MEPALNGMTCIEVAELMPYAKSVGAKTYNFDSDGNETKIDYKK